MYTKSSVNLYAADINISPYLFHLPPIAFYFAENLWRIQDIISSLNDMYLKQHIFLHNHNALSYTTHLVMIP